LQDLCRTGHFGVPSEDFGDFSVKGGESTGKVCGDAGLFLGEAGKRGDKEAVARGAKVGDCDAVGGGGLDVVRPCGVELDCVLHRVRRG